MDEPTLPTLDLPPPPSDAVWPAPRVPDPRLTKPFGTSPLMWVGVAAVGVLFDAVLRHPPASVSTGLFLSTIAVSLLISGHLRTRQSAIAAVLVPIFAAWVVVRSSPWLIPLNIVTASALLVVATATASDAQLLRYGFRDIAAMPLRLVTDGIASVRHLGNDIATRPAEAQRDRLRQVALGLAIAIPLVLTVGGLLAAGDDAFASLVGSISNTSAGLHGLAIAAGALGAFAAIYAASRADVAPLATNRRPLGAIETVTILAALTLVYALFTVAQLVNSVSDIGAILQDSAETRAWVHAGFFPLLWASGITLGALLLIDHLTLLETSRHHTWYRRFVAAVALLTVVVAATAVYRIGQYSVTFGLTMLRLTTIVFASWIGVVFLLYAIRTMGIHRKPTWFPTIALATALVVVFGLNVVNPERFVVSYNLDRADTVSVDHLVKLSDDATRATCRSLR